MMFHYGKIIDQRSVCRQAVYIVVSFHFIIGTCRESFVTGGNTSTHVIHALQLSYRNFVAKKTPPHCTFFVVQFLDCYVCFLKDPEKKFYGIYHIAFLLVVHIYYPAKS